MIEEERVSDAMREWLSYETWTLREGLLILSGIDPHHSECFKFSPDCTSIEAAIPEGQLFGVPMWCRIGSPPRAEVDADGVPRIVGPLFSPDDSLRLWELMERWHRTPEHEGMTRASPAHFVAWSVRIEKAPFWLNAVRSSGHAPSLNDSSSVLARIRAGVPDVPRDHELMSLQELANLLQVRADLDRHPASVAVVRALLGVGELAGMPPEALRVYHRFVGGPSLLSADPFVIDADDPPRPSERETALRHLSLRLVLGSGSIDDVPADSLMDGKPAGCYLAVVRADALVAFGLRDAAVTRALRTSGEVLYERLGPAGYAAVFGGRPPGSVHSQREPAMLDPCPVSVAAQSALNPAPAVDLKPTKKPGDDWTPADYAELLRQYESLTTGKGAMKGESAREALGKAWSYAPNSIKPFLTTARKLRTPTT